MKKCRYIVVVILSIVCVFMCCLVVQRVRCNELVRKINEYYTRGFRCYTIWNTDFFREYPGNVLDYKVYLVAEDTLWIDMQLDNYSETSFWEDVFPQIDSEWNLVYSYDPMKYTSKEYICRGSIYVEKKEELVFDEFEDKQELLAALEEALRLRYFSEDKSNPYNRPVYHESTRTKEIWIMDIGPYDVLRYMVFTEDGCVYETRPQRMEDGTFDLYEIPAGEVRLSDIEEWNQADEEARKVYDRYLQGFAVYYNYFKEHTVKCLKPE